VIGHKPSVYELFFGPDWLKQFQAVAMATDPCTFRQQLTDQQG